METYALSLENAPFQFVLAQYDVFEHLQTTSLCKV
jgi:hypothetical protein